MILSFLIYIRLPCHIVISLECTGKIKMHTSIQHKVPCLKFVEVFPQLFGTLNYILNNSPVFKYQHRPFLFCWFLCILEVTVDKISFSTSFYPTLLKC